MNLGRETEFIEFKKSTAELKEGMASLAAILTKHGSGTLYFGVRNNGEVCGQQVSDSTLRAISQAVGNYIRPTVYPLIVRETTDDGLEYVRVSFAGDDGPYACDGRYRIRVADEDVLMSPEEVRLRSAKAGLRRHPWDERVSDKNANDVDQMALRAFVKRGNDKGRIVEEYDDATKVLERLGLLEDGRLLNAGAALFCPSGRIDLKMGILESHTRTEILDLQQEEGLVFDLVRKAEIYIMNNTRRRLVIKGGKPREDVPEIPRKAVHEALMNAYAHRDWFDGGSVVVDIYYDSVEIISPGWFIDGQDPNDHLSGASVSSKTRNGLITKTLYRSGDIEAYGSGIPRIKELCDEAGIRVEYVRVAEGTKLVFHRNPLFENILEEKPQTPQEGSQTPQEGSQTPQEGSQTPQEGSQTPQETFAQSLSSYDSAIVAALAGGPLGRNSLLAALGLSDRKNLRERYIVPALKKGLIELEIPDKPKSKNQRYRLTARGNAALRSWEG
ncbi:Fic family protein [Adlercreutzia sp. ZJ141]|uniref:Fic family protein n=1 Tax=Adlercreutzia sp. ZJ141 TaxID=2709406 RepID=UPI0013ECDDF9|nr:ATP-binding protein [Adlercreutzia sp. ZJ141]